MCSLLPQEERVSLLLDDLREELLDRLDGLQLRLQVSQAAELDGQQRSSKSLQRLVHLDAKYINQSRSSAAFLAWAP